VTAASDPWVLFDLDGTLFDYRASEAAAVRATLADAGVPATDEVVGVYRRVNARHWAALEAGRTTAARLRLERWSEVLAEVGLRPDVEVEVLAERYLCHLAAGTHLLADAVEVVARVARTHRIGYLTNGLADVQRPRLGASPLGELAEVTIVSDEVGAAKPDPAILDAAFGAMGEPAREDVTLVRDSLSADVAAAAAYGLRSVWVAAPTSVLPPEAPQPTHRIARLADLPPLLAT
jgi:HAD superfamily hydrolase (TIGR01549 family)